MLDPFSWRSRNQEVPCVLFVKLSSHKKVSVGVGRVDPQRFCRDYPKRTLRAYSARARGSFLVEKKGTKDSPKRRCPLWILLWRGTSPRELRKAKFSPPDFPLTRWLLGFASVTPRVVGTYVERTRYRYRGVSKGVMLDPFRWRSRNQEVPCAPFVHFLAIGNGPRGAGAGSHPANRLCRKFGEGNFVSFSCPHHKRCGFAESPSAGLG